MSKFSSEIADLAAQPGNRERARARAIAREIAAEIKSIDGDGSLQPVQKSLRLSAFDADLAALEHLTARPADPLHGLGMTMADGNAPAESSSLGVKGSAPRIALDRAQLKAMHDALQSRSQYRAVVKDVTAIAGPHIPAQLAPGIMPRPLEPTRVADHLPSTAMGAAIERIIQHSSTTGTAATVAAGVTKPAVTLGLTHIDLSPSKIAVTTTLVDEDLADLSEFSTYVTGALQHLLIDAENNQLLLGDGTGTNVLGLLNQSGAQTTAVITASSEIGIDAVERGITLLRTGSAYGDADLLVMHPATFSALRRSKDAQGRFYLNPDPTADEATKLWGLDVCLTTQMTAGKCLIADTKQAAKLFVREGISVKMGPYGDGDFTANRTTFIVEERVALGVLRPTALCVVTGLATS